MHYSLSRRTRRLNNKKLIKWQAALLLLLFIAVPCFAQQDETTATLTLLTTEINAKDFRGTTRTVPLELAFSSSATYFIHVSIQDKEGRPTSPSASWKIDLEGVSDNFRLHSHCTEFALRSECHEDQLFDVFPITLVFRLNKSEDFDIRIWIVYARPDGAPTFTISEDIPATITVLPSIDAISLPDGIAEGEQTTITAQVSPDGGPIASYSWKVLDDPPLLERPVTSNTTATLVVAPPHDLLSASETTAQVVLQLMVTDEAGSTVTAVRTMVLSKEDNDEITTAELKGLTDSLKIERLAIDFSSRTLTAPSLDLSWDSDGVGEVLAYQAQICSAANFAGCADGWRDYASSRSAVLALREGDGRGELSEKFFRVQVLYRDAQGYENNPYFPAVQYVTTPRITAVAPAPLPTIENPLVVPFPSGTTADLKVKITGLPTDEVASSDDDIVSARLRALDTKEGAATYIYRLEGFKSGTATITITATGDTGVTTRVEAVVRVNSPPQVNRKIGSQTVNLPDRSLSAGFVATATVATLEDSSTPSRNIFTDENDDLLSYRVVHNLPASATITAHRDSDGVILRGSMLQPTTMTAGEIVEVIADDGFGGSTQTTFTLIVQSPSTGTVRIEVDPLLDELRARDDIEDLNGIVSKTYQWFKGNTKISGATTSVYELAENNEARNSGIKYTVQVVVTDIYGATQTHSASMSLPDRLPLITDVRVPMTAAEGSTITFVTRSFDPNYEETALNWRRAPYGMSVLDETSLGSSSTLRYRIPDSFIQSKTQTTYHMRFNLLVENTANPSRSEKDFYVVIRKVDNDQITTSELGAVSSIGRTLALPAVAESILALDADGMGSISSVRYQWQHCTTRCYDAERTEWFDISTNSTAHSYTVLPSSSTGTYFRVAVAYEDAQGYLATVYSEVPNLPMIDSASLSFPDRIVEGKQATITAVVSAIEGRHITEYRWSVRRGPALLKEPFVSNTTATLVFIPPHDLASADDLTTQVTLQLRATDDAMLAVTKDVTLNIIKEDNDEITTEELAELTDSGELDRVAIDFDERRLTAPQLDLSFDSDGAGEVDRYLWQRCENQPNPAACIDNAAWQSFPSGTDRTSRRRRTSSSVILTDEESASVNENDFFRVRVVYHDAQGYGEDQVGAIEDPNKPFFPAVQYKNTPPRIIAVMPPSFATADSPIQLLPGNTRDITVKIKDNTGQVSTVTVVSSNIEVVSAVLLNSNTGVGTYTFRLTGVEVGTATVRISARDDQGLQSSVEVHVRVERTVFVTVGGPIATTEGWVTTIFADEVERGAAYSWEVLNGPALLKGPVTSTRTSTLVFTPPHDLVSMADTAAQVTLQLSVTADGNIVTTITQIVIVAKVDNDQITSFIDNSIPQFGSDRSTLTAPMVPFAEDSDGVGVAENNVYRWQRCPKDMTCLSDGTNWQDAPGTFAQAAYKILAANGIEAGDRFRVQVTYTDGQGYQAPLFSIVLTYDPDNSQPQIITPPSFARMISVQAGREKEIAVQVRDSDPDDILTLSLSAGDLTQDYVEIVSTHQTVPTNASAVRDAQIRIKGLKVGATTLTLIAADNSGSEVNSTSVEVALNIMVTANNPPTITGLPETGTAMLPQAMRTFTMRVADADSDDQDRVENFVALTSISANDEVVNAVEISPATGAERQLTITSGMNIGMATIMVTVSDGRGVEGSSTATVMFTVRVEANEAPAIGAPLHQTIQLGSTEAMTVTVHDENMDADDRVTVVAISSSASIVEISPTTQTVAGELSTSTLSFTLTPLAAGTATLILTATDSKGATARAWVSVLVNRQPTVVASIEDQVVTIGTTLNRTVVTDGVFTDDDGDALSYTASGFPSASNLALSADGNLFTTPTDARVMGDATQSIASAQLVTVSADDGKGGTTETTFKLLFNAEPTGTVSIATNVGPGLVQLIADISRVEDANGINIAETTYQWLKHNGTAFAAIEGATSRVYMPQLRERTVGNRYRVELVFTDNIGTTWTASAERTIEDEPPRIIPITPQTVFEGQDAVIRAMAIDFNNDALTYQWSILEGDKSPSLLRDVVVNQTSLTFALPPDWVVGGAAVLQTTLTLQLSVTGAGVETTTQATVVVIKIDNDRIAGFIDNSIPQFGLDRSTLTAPMVPFAEDADGVGMAANNVYRWQRCPKDMTCLSDGTNWQDAPGTFAQAIYKILATNSIEAGDQFRVRVTYTDGQGYQASLFSIVLTYDPDNSQPQIITPPSFARMISVQAGREKEIAVQVRDSDSEDILTLSLSASDLTQDYVEIMTAHQTVPTNASAVRDAQIRIKGLKVGATTLTLIAADNSGSEVNSTSVEVVLNIMVTANNPPTITGLPETSTAMLPQAMRTFTMRVADADSDDQDRVESFVALTSISANDEVVNAVEISPATGAERQLTITSGMNTGMATIMVTVSDGRGVEGSSTATVMFTVTVEANEAPIIIEAPLYRTVQLGSTEAMTVAVRDENLDADDRVTVVAISSSASVVEISPTTQIVAGELPVSTLSFTLTPVAVGTATLTLTATDSKGATTRAQVSVLVNRQPTVVAGIEDQVVTIGTTLSRAIVTGIFSDADGDALSYTATGLPSVSNLALSSDGNLFTTPTDARVMGDATQSIASAQLVTVSADDGNGGTAEATFKLLFNAEPTGTVSIATSVGPGLVQLVADISRVEDANGINAAETTYQWLKHNGTVFSAIEGATSKVYMPQPTERTVGNRYRVELVFTDNIGTTWTASAERTIEDEPPRIIPIAPQTVQEGQDVVIRATAIDFNNDPLTYQWSVLEGDKSPSILRGIAVDQTSLTFALPPDWVVGGAAVLQTTLTLQLSVTGAGIETTTQATVVVIKIDNDRIAGFIDNSIPQFGLDRSTLTAPVVPFAEDADGVGMAANNVYRWQRCPKEATTCPAIGAMNWQDAPGPFDQAAYKILAANGITAGDRFRVRVTYTDGQGYQAPLFSIVLTYDPDNSQPQIITPPSFARMISVQEGREKEISVQVRDSDPEDLLALSLSASDAAQDHVEIMPAHQTVSTNGRAVRDAQIRIKGLKVGATTLTLIATDNSGSEVNSTSVEVALNIMVTANNPPTITGLPETGTAMLPQATRMFTMQVADADSDDKDRVENFVALTSISANDDVINTVEISPATGAERQLTITSGMNTGMATIMVTVSDGRGVEGSSTATVVFTVTVEANEAPTIIGAPTRRTLQLGSTEAMTVTVLDENLDADDRVTVVAISSSASIVEILPTTQTVAGELPGSTLSFTLTAVAVGMATLTVTATDSKGATTHARVLVLVNRQPMVVASIAHQIVTIGTTLSRAILTGIFSDADGDTLSYTASGLPSISNLALSSDGNLFTTPTNASVIGDATRSIALAQVVTVSADDGNGGTTETTFKLLFNAEPIGTVFIYASAGLTRLTADISDVADANGTSETTYQWFKHDGNTFRPVGGTTTSRVYMLPPKERTVGTQYRVDVMFTDNIGATTVLSVEHTISNQAPLITLPTEQFMVDEGEAVSITVGAVDPNDDDITYLWSILAGDKHPSILTSVTVTQPTLVLNIPPDWNEANVDRALLTLFALVQDRAILSAKLVPVYIRRVDNGQIATPKIKRVGRSRVLTLDAIDFASDPDGAGTAMPRYQWQICRKDEDCDDQDKWKDVSLGTDVFYRVQQRDTAVGDQFRVQVTYRDGQGYQETVNSQPFVYEFESVRVRLKLFLEGALQ